MAYVILFTLSFVYLAFVLLLILKIIEALTRIFGKIGFSESPHTVDSGLIGVCGLLGCCGSPMGRRSRRRRTRSRATHSDLPPITSQVTLPLAARQNSTPTQSGPPSIFRPEHALRPYREDNDHDTGFIMGAWRPFPRPGYNPVDNPESPGKSGFSRVGGGRSHFDAPYSIATGSVHTFPSATAEQPPTPQRNSHESNPSVTPSITIAERQLPPGAMPPHVRKKSQTAIIEHAPVPPRAGESSTVPSSFRRHSQLWEATSPVSDDDASEVNQPTRKRHWFQLRKARRHSDGDEARPADVAQTDNSGDTGRSFVVVRSRKTSQPMAGESGTSGTSNAPPAKSFVVLRGKDNPPT